MSIQADNVGSILAAGLLGGLRTALGLLAMTALIWPYGGPETAAVFYHLSAGAILAGAWISARSALQSAIGQPQDTPALILSVVAAPAVAAGATLSDAYSLTIATLGVAAAITALLMLGLARFNLGSAVRYLPFQVVGGFVVGSGIAIVLSALAFMFQVRSLKEIFTSTPSAEQWQIVLIGGFTFIALRAISKLRRGSSFSPIVLIVVILLVNTFVSLDNGFSPEQLSHWYLGGGLDSSAAVQFKWFWWSGVPWSALVENATSIAAAALLSCTVLLLNISGLESATRKDFDVNHELGISGAANLTTALMGGLITFHSFSASLLGKQFGVDARAIGFISYGFILIFALAGSILIANIPVPVVGGLLLSVGVGVVDDWLKKNIDKFRKLDFFVLSVIVFAMLLLDYLIGIAIGLALSFAFFVFQYSQVKAIDIELDGGACRSNVERDNEATRILVENKNALRLMKLEGFLFFGTAYQVFEVVKKRAQEGVRHLILDFSKIKQVDSSAANIFSKIVDLTVSNQINLYIVRADPVRVVPFLGKAATDSNVRIFLERDRAVEECENAMLISSGYVSVSGRNRLRSIFSSRFSSAETFEKFLNYFSLERFSEGEVLAKQGDPADRMFFVESGKIDVEISPFEPGRPPIRISSITKGEFVGEVAVYSGSKRTASLVVREPATVYSLSRQALQLMEEQDPRLAREIHRFILTTMSERLVALNNMVRQLDP